MHARISLSVKVHFIKNTLVISFHFGFRPHVSREITEDSNHEMSIVVQPRVLPIYISVLSFIYTYIYIYITRSIGVLCHAK